MFCRREISREAPRVLGQRVVQRHAACHCSPVSVLAATLAHVAMLAMLRLDFLDSWRVCSVTQPATSSRCLALPCSLSHSLPEYAYPHHLQWRSLPLGRANSPTTLCKVAYCSPFCHWIHSATAASPPRPLSLSLSPHRSWRSTRSLSLVPPSIRYNPEPIEQDSCSVTGARHMVCSRRAGDSFI